MQGFNRMYEEQFSKTLTKLRLQKGISARDLSLSLGLSESYINRIESNRMLPSMSVFFYICDYFGITPADFFNLDSDETQQSTESQLQLLSAMKKLQSLSSEKRSHIIAVINDL